MASGHQIAPDTEPSSICCQRVNAIDEARNVRAARDDFAFVRLGTVRGVREVTRCSSDTLNAIGLALPGEHRRAEGSTGEPKHALPMISGLAHQRTRRLPCRRVVINDPNIGRRLS
jgi:hypothetical protein